MLINFDEHANMVLTTTPEEREDWRMAHQTFSERPREFSYWDMVDMLVDWINNDLGTLPEGWEIGRIAPYEVGALTDAPILGVVNGGSFPRTILWVWWYPNYMVADPIEDLISGQTTFKFGG